MRRRCQCPPSSWKYRSVDIHWMGTEPGVWSLECLWFWRRKKLDWHAAPMRGSCTLSLLDFGAVVQYLHAT